MESSVEPLDKTDPVPVAVIGCGAVTQKKILPAIAASRRLIVSALVDVDKDRLNHVANQYNIPNRFPDLSGIAGCARFAVNAVPHHLHASVSLEAIRAGLHVFVEKPLTTNMLDAARMLDSARSAGLKIGVGLVRRQYPSVKLVKTLLEEGHIGNVLSFDFQEGGAYNWPITTLATFERATAGGVLFDTGAHTLDMLLYWLGRFATVDYREDAHDGVDANCLLNLTLENGVVGRVELSRTRTLRNTCIIRGDRGELEVGVAVRGPVLIRKSGVELASEPRFTGQDFGTALDFTRVQIEEFVAAVSSGKDCELFAENTLESIRLFDACKKGALSIPMPWDVDPAYNVPDLEGRKILVVGGTGFIGGRLVETLARFTRADVRVMYRAPERLSNASRFAVEFVQGDITDRRSLRDAMAGCDLLFNCSMGRGDRAAQDLVNVKSLSVLLREAARAGLRKVVHLSTVSAYGVLDDGTLHEDSTLHAARSYVYGHSKWHGERVGLAVSKEVGVPFVVLQPTIVYGPGAPSWTQNVLRMLKSGSVVLVNDGTGICNAVYVDDVVQAMLCAADSTSGDGERFLISGPEAVTWREFYSAYESMLGQSATVSLTLDQLRLLRSEQRKSMTSFAQIAALVRDPLVYRRLARLPMVEKAKSLLPRRTIVTMKSAVLGEPDDPATGRRDVSSSRATHVWSSLDANLQSKKVFVSIEKARRILGYAPTVGFEEGMHRTKTWAQWANLLV